MKSLRSLVLAGLVIAGLSGCTDGTNPASNSDALSHEHTVQHLTQDDINDETGMPYHMEPGVLYIAKMPADTVAADNPEDIVEPVLPTNPIYDLGVRLGVRNEERYGGPGVYVQREIVNEGDVPHIGLMGFIYQEGPNGSVIHQALSCDGNLEAGEKCVSYVWMQRPLFGAKHGDEVSISLDTQYLVGYADDNPSNNEAKVLYLNKTEDGIDLMLEK